MSPFSKWLFWSSFCFILSFAFQAQQLSAYVVVPRSNSDITDRMNASGDPPDRAGLRDAQRSAEYLDDWWGRNDYHYHYSEVGPKPLRHPTYDLDRPPYYPYPNPLYYDTTNPYNYDSRYYRPAYPR